MIEEKLISIKESSAEPDALIGEIIENFECIFVSFRQ